MSNVARHGLPAAASVVLGASAGLLGNAFSNGWAWPVGVAFAMAVMIEAAWVGTRAVLERREVTGLSSGSGAPTDTTPATDGQHDTGTGKYQVQALDAKGIQVGDHNTQQNTFT
jgi:hypothetical protein